MAPIISGSKSKAAILCGPWSSCGRSPPDLIHKRDIDQYGYVSFDGSIPRKKEIGSLSGSELSGKVRCFKALYGL
jgi:hypothetical protein